MFLWLRSEKLIHLEIISDTISHEIIPFFLSLCAEIIYVMELYVDVAQVVGNGLGRYIVSIYFNELLRMRIEDYFTTPMRK